MFAAPFHFHGAFEKGWNMTVHVNKHEELLVVVVGQNAENEMAVEEEVADHADNPNVVVVVAAAGQPKVEGQNPVPNYDHDSLDYYYTSLKCKLDIQLTLLIKQQKEKKNHYLHTQ